MFAGRLPIKKRAFIPPSLKGKDVVATQEGVIEMAIEESAAASIRPVAKRRRLLACPVIGSKDVLHPDTQVQSQHKEIKTLISCFTEDKSINCNLRRQRLT